MANNYYIKLIANSNGLFWAGHVWGAKNTPLPEVCSAYPTKMKLGTVMPYLKEIQRFINHVTHPFSSADINIFPPEISKFCYIETYKYRLDFGTYFLIVLTSFEYSNIVF